MKFFAIRRILDGKLMPQGKYPSRTEFSDYGPPRLFPTRGGAQTSLRMWCEGYWATERAFESTNEFGEGFYYQGLPVPIGKGQRDPNDYGVVEVQLTVLEEHEHG
jgi:hypothetical protein